MLLSRKCVHKLVQIFATTLTKHQRYLSKHTNIYLTMQSASCAITIRNSNLQVEQNWESLHVCANDSFDQNRYVKRNVTIVTLAFTRPQVSPLVRPRGTWIRKTVQLFVVRKERNNVLTEKE